MKLYNEDNKIEIDCHEVEDEEILDADSEDNNNYSIFSESEEDDDTFYGPAHNINRKLIERSFTNLGYIGYGDGINLEELD